MARKMFLYAQWRWFIYQMEWHYRNNRRWSAISSEKAAKIFYEALVLSL